MAPYSAPQLDDEEWDDLVICIEAGRRAEVEKARRVTSSKSADAHLARARRIVSLGQKLSYARRQRLEDQGRG